MSETGRQDPVSRLKDIVEETNDMDTLLRLIPKLGVTKDILKQILVEYVCAMTQTQAQSQLNWVLPINELLPRRAIESICLWTHDIGQRACSKEFDEVYRTNQSLIKQDRERVAEEYKTTIEIPLVFDSILGRTVKVPYVPPLERNSSSGKRLAETLRRTDITSFIQTCKSGDRIVLPKGDYKWRNREEDFNIVLEDKCLEIVGAEKGVRIFAENGTVRLFGKAMLSLRNVEVDLRENNRPEGFKLERGSQLIATDCILRHRKFVVRAGRNTKVILSSCKLRGENGVWTDTHEIISCDIQAVDCTFEIFTWAIRSRGDFSFYGCIFRGGMIGEGSTDAGRVLVGNVFENWWSNRVRQRWERVNRIEIR